MSRYEYLDGQRVLVRDVSIYDPPTSHERAARRTTDPLVLMALGVADAAGCALRARSMTDIELRVEAMTARYAAADRYAGDHPSDAREAREIARARILSARRELARRGASR